MKRTVLIIFSAAGLLFGGFALGAYAQKKFLEELAEKEDVFEQFCEICIDKLDDGEVYYD